MVHIPKNRIPPAPPVPPVPAQRLPDDTQVICPHCCHEFRAIPVQVQRLLQSSGHLPPFLQRSLFDYTPLPAGQLDTLLLALPDGDAMWFECRLGEDTHAEVSKYIDAWLRTKTPAELAELDASRLQASVMYIRMFERSYRALSANTSPAGLEYVHSLSTPG